MSKNKAKAAKAKAAKATRGHEYTAQGSINPAVVIIGGTRCDRRTRKPL